MAHTDTPARLQDLAATLSAGLGKVSAKFVQDALSGIYRASSVNLTEVGLALDEPIPIHATQKRLSRNLARPDVHETVTRRLLELAARRVRQDTPLYVHVRELRKQYARKMEYLAPQAGEPAGYRICEVVASQLGSNRYTPVIAHLWSPHSPDFASNAAEVVKVIERVLAATNGRGVFYPDASVYAHGVTVEQLADIAGFRAVLDVPQRTEPWLEPTFVATIDTPFAITLYKMLPDGVEDFVVSQVGALDVEDRGVTRSLIVLRWDSPRTRELLKPPQLYLSTVPVQNDRETLTGLVAGIVSGVEVVAASDAHKDAYRLAEFRVLRFQRMRTLLALLQAVTFYDAAIARRARITTMRASLRPFPGDHPRTFLVPDSLVRGKG